MLDALNSGSTLGGSLSSQSFIKDVLKFLPKNTLKEGIADPNIAAAKASIKDVENARTALREILGADPQTVTFGDSSVVQNTSAASKSKTLGETLGDFVNYVDEKQKVSAQATLDVLTGKSDNIHQSVLANQEAGVAFSLLLEIRNKLVDSYKELMRMAI